MNAKDRQGLARRMAGLLGEGGESGPARLLATLWTESLLASPLASLVDPEPFVELAMDALGGAGFEDLAARHAAPGFAREQARVAGGSERMGDAVPAALVEAIGERLSRPSGLPPGWSRGLVDTQAVMDLVSSALADTFDEIVAALPGASRGGAPGRGRESGLFGALGAGLFEKLGGQLRGMAGMATRLLREALLRRLRSPEGQAAIARMRTRAVQHVLSLRLEELYRVAEDPGPERLAEWVAQALRHNLARAEIRAAVQEQVREALARQGEQSLGEWLDAAGLREPARRAIISHLEGHLVALASAPDFAQWLNDWMASAEK